MKFLKLSTGQHAISTLASIYLAAYQATSRQQRQQCITTLQMQEMDPGRHFAEATVNPIKTGELIESESTEQSRLMPGIICREVPDELPEPSKAKPGNIQPRSRSSTPFLQLQHMSESESKQENVSLEDCLQNESSKQSAKAEPGLLPASPKKSTAIASICTEEGVCFSPSKDKVSAVSTVEKGACPTATHPGASNQHEAAAKSRQEPEFCAQSQKADQKSKASKADQENNSAAGGQFNGDLFSARLNDLIQGTSSPGKDNGSSAYVPCIMQEGGAFLQVPADKLGMR